MRLYASSRRLVTLITIAIVTALLPLATRTTLGFPDVIGAGGGTVMPLHTLTPMVLAITLAWSFTARRTHLSAGAVRRTERADVAVLIGTVMFVAATSALTHGDLTAARNAAILSAVVVIVTCLVNPAAGGAAVTISVLIIVTYGRTAPGARFVRVLQAPPDALWPSALAVALTLAASATLAMTNPTFTNQ